MKPKNYKGKGTDNRPVPFFSLTELVKEDDCCHLMIMSDSTIRAIREAIQPIYWPTRWANEDSEEDVDEFLRGIGMQLIPCDGIVYSLTEAIDRLNNTIANTGNQGDSSMSGCGCRCGCSGGQQSGEGGYDPVQFPNVPELPSEVSPTNDRDCMFAHYIFDKVLGVIDTISTRLAWGGVAITVGILVSLLVAQIEITGAMVASLWALFSQGVLTSAGVASVYDWLNSRKASFVCYVATNSNNSPASFKNAVLAWLHSQGDDNTPAITMLSIIFNLSPMYNRMLSDSWIAGYEDVTCCGDAPTLPEGAYSLVPASLLTVGTVLGIDGQEASYVYWNKVDNRLTLHASLEAGEGFKAPVAVLKDATPNFVGFAVMCKSLAKTTSSNPTYTYVRETPSEVIEFGVLYQGGGMCGISTDESGTELDEFVAYLEGMGFDTLVNLDPSIEGEINVADFWTCNVYDKEGVGGHGGSVDVQYEFFHIIKA